MKPLTAPEIRGTWGTLLLPINDDESINDAKLSDEIDYLIAAGVDGIYSNGTAGEFYAQSEDEFDRVSQLLAEKCERAEMPFQIGASFMNAQITLDRARRASQFKPSAIQIILPDWSPVTLEEAIVFLQRITEAVAPVTLVLYNPPHAKRVLQPRELAMLCEAVPSLVGVKVAGGDAEWYAAMRPLLSRLSVFVTGHLLPFREKYGASNQALDKLLAAVGDWADVGTRLRWPYRGIDEVEAAPLCPIARRMIPELFESEETL